MMERAELFYVVSMALVVAFALSMMIYEVIR